MSVLKEHSNMNRDNPSSGSGFTVVITSYNKGKYLKQAVDSVRGQTLQDVQLIVVDDCSDDPGTIRDLNEISDGVHLIRSDRNKGVSSARNEGIRNSDSEYICCLDGDDHLEPTYLEKARNAFENNKDAGIVTSFVKQFGSFSAKKEIREDRVSLISMLSNNIIPSSSCFRREASVKVGMYDEGLESHEDWEHWINMIKDGWKIKVIPEYLINSRMLRGSKYRDKVSNADVYYSYIINKHRELYKKHWVEIFTAKHLKSNEYHIRIRRFKSFLLFRIGFWVLITSRKFFPESLFELIYKRLVRY